MIKIKELRARHDMTQVELAKMLGCSESTMSAWEKNPHKINGKALIQLARHFNVSADDILGIGEKGSG